MARQPYTPIFEEDESIIKDRMLDNISDEWRKEPGDFIYDAVAPNPLEIKQLEANLDFVFQNSIAAYAEGQYLDYKLAEVGLTRIAATPTKRSLSITAAAGVTIPKDQTISVLLLDANSNPIEYITDQAITFATSTTVAVPITCKTAGIVGNVPNGSTFIMQPPIPGITNIVDTGITVFGTDQETDDSAYSRYQYKLQNPDTGGNKNDYVRWALKEGLGVGKAKCIPRWNGNGTVKVVILGTDFMPASTAVVTAVQNYIDPGQTGLGDGKAPCGAMVTVIAATAVTINITATVSLITGAVKANVVTAFSNAVKNYLAQIAFTGNDVILAKIGSLLIGTDGVNNYSNLKLNNATSDISIGVEAVAVLGAVTL